MDVQLPIGDGDGPADSGRLFERQSPVAGLPPSRAAAGGASDARHAADAAAAAFPTWSRTAPNERRSLLLRAADIMAGKREAFAEAMLRETGATASWAGFNTALAAAILREAACMTTQASGEVLREAGLPPGVLNVVTNAPEDAGAVVEALIAHPAVKRINFTGSTRVGRIIAETAGRHLKPVLLELGGKAPSWWPAAGGTAR